MHLKNMRCSKKKKIVLAAEDERLQESKVKAVEFPPPGFWINAQAAALLFSDANLAPSGFLSVCLF